MKRQKEEKRAYNEASGKNVDIDFEIMIEKNRFKDKKLDQHKPSTEDKVESLIFSYQFVFEKGPFSKKRSKMGKQIQSLLQILN